MLTSLSTQCLAIRNITLYYIIISNYVKTLSNNLKMEENPPKLKKKKKYLTLPLSPNQNRLSRYMQINMWKGKFSFS